MHTFHNGAFKNQNIEQAMLGDAPGLYRLMKWVREEDIRRLRSALKDFDLLRRKLCCAAITAECHQRGCGATASWMTFPVDKEGMYRPAPYYWCDKHDPWENTGISQKHRVHFDAISLMKTKAEQKSIFKQLKIILGIPAGTRITNEFAQNFFVKLG